MPMVSRMMAIGVLCKTLERCFALSESSISGSNHGIWKKTWNDQSRPSR